MVSGRAESKGDNRRDVGKAEERRRKRGACFAWNDGSCRLPYCRFEHVCSGCFGEHTAGAALMRERRTAVRGGGPWASDPISYVTRQKTALCQLLVDFGASVG